MMKVAPKQAAPNPNRSTIAIDRHSGQNQLAQFDNNSKEAVTQRALIAGINDSPHLLAQRRQIESYIGTGRQQTSNDSHQPKNQPPIQRLEETDDEEKELLQLKPDLEFTVQREQQASSKPNTTGLPDNLKPGIESLSGLSMDSVKVHYNSSQPAQFNALAYAQGADIHIAPGQEQHLPHEAWHVVQQTQGRVKPTVRMNAGVPVNDDEELEREADVMGIKALQMKDAKAALAANDPAHKLQKAGTAVPLSTGSAVQAKNTGIVQRAPDNENISYPITVPKGLTSEQELDQYAEVLIFHKVLNMKWKFMGWDVKALAGKTVTYAYPASFVSKNGGKQTEAAAKPAPSNPAYTQTKGKEREAINNEVDKRYWKGTHTGEGEKIKKGEQAKADMWNVYRDEVMNDKKALQDIPPELKELMGGEASFKPQDYTQLLRIAEKLKRFSKEDIAVYKMLSLRATDNLSLFEKSVDMFLARKEELKEALKQYEEQNKSKAPQSMQDAIDESWKGFDNSKIGKLSEANQYDLARQKTWDVTKTQLEYMKNHPGETLTDFAKAATLLNTGETFSGIGKDITEAAKGDANAWARWAGGVGAGAKLSGWLLAVGGVMYVLSWLTGVGELATIAAFMGAMLATTIVLSTTESELRIKAASKAKTPEEFQEQVTKAAAARTNVIIMIGLLAIALAFRFVAKTFFPETMGKIGKSLAKFREKIRIVGKLSELKAEFAAEMEGYKQKLTEAGKTAKESSKAQADALNKMSTEEFIDKMESGKGDFFQEASVQDGQKIQWKALAQTPEGLKSIEAYKAQLADALRNTVAKEIDAMVKEQTDAIDRMLEKVNKATVPGEFEQALKDQEKFLSDEEVAKRGKEREQQMVKEKTEEALKKIEEEIKKAAEKKNPYDDLDEHALEKMTDAEKAKVFAEEAKRGIHRGVKVRNKTKSIDFELDRIDTKKGLIIEDKIAKGFERNPNPTKAAHDWAEKQIYTKTKNKIEFIQNNADHVYYDPKSNGSPHLPTLDQVKAIKHFEFRLKVNQSALSADLMSVLQTEISSYIKTLKAEFPDWSFDVVFGD
ncbi:MAG: eCIS core domain-containing protein [Methylobacter sp.]